MLCFLWHSATLLRRKLVDDIVESIIGLPAMKLGD
jgi:hypothetical protein